MVDIAKVEMTLEEYMALIRQLQESTPQKIEQVVTNAPAQSQKRRRSAYSRKYKAAFKKVAPKYKLKSGKWKKGGFKAAVKAAHKAVKK